MKQSNRIFALLKPTIAQELVSIQLRVQ